MTQYAVVNWEGEMAPIVKKGVGVEEKYAWFARECVTLCARTVSVCFWFPPNGKKLKLATRDCKINLDC